MCKFKSGLILRDRIVIAPIMNDSHSNMLSNFKIADDYFGASHIFVRAELIPPRGDKTRDVQDWEFVVDQDIVPDWFKVDQEKYERRFREEIKNWMKSNIFIFAGLPWTKIKTDEKGTYYLLADIYDKNQFGSNNDYSKSVIREQLASSYLLKELMIRFGNKMVPINLSLTSLDGLKDYGNIDGDLLSIPSLDLYRECREKIPNIDSWWWLATPDSTPSGWSLQCVQCVGGDGGVRYNDCEYTGGVRPFFILNQ